MESPSISPCSHSDAIAAKPHSVNPACSLRIPEIPPGKTRPPPESSIRRSRTRTLHSSPGPDGVSLATSALWTCRRQHAVVEVPARHRCGHRRRRSPGRPPRRSLPPSPPESLPPPAREESTRERPLYVKPFIPRAEERLTCVATRLRTRPLWWHRGPLRRAAHDVDPYKGSKIEHPEWRVGG